MISSILKKFFRGVLYLFVLPLLCAVLAVYAVIGVFMFFFLGIKAIILFFTGRNLFGDLPEDIKARQILNGESQQYVLETNTTNIPVQGEDLIIGDSEPEVNDTPTSTLPPEMDNQTTTPPTPDYFHNDNNNGEGSL